MKHIKYKKIPNLSNVIRHIEKKKDHYPSVIEFTGEVKLHGENASIIYSGSESLCFQSRNRIITPENDNYGFAFWADQRKEKIVSKIKNIFTDLGCVEKRHSIAVFGEWVGKDVQKETAISSLKEKRFFVFDTLLIYNQIEGIDNFHNLIVDSDAYSGIFDNVCNYPRYNIQLDMNNLDSCKQDIEKYTKEVVDECPIGKKLGLSGGGEGIVWKNKYYGLSFKTKGDIHTGLN